MWVYLNDGIVNKDEARISVFDRGFLYGDGVFETVRIYEGYPVWLYVILHDSPAPAGPYPPDSFFLKRIGPTSFSKSLTAISYIMQ